MVIHEEHITLIAKLSLKTQCQSHVYVIIVIRKYFLKETITVSNTLVVGAAANNVNKKVVFKICAPFTDCPYEINNTHVYNGKDTDVLMLVYNLIEYSYNYSKTWKSMTVL